MAHSEKCKCETCMIVTPYSPSYHKASPKVEEWQKTFLDAGTYETGTDLSCMIPTVSSLLLQKDEQRKKEVEEAYEMGKKYGHDLGIRFANLIPDEETVERITLTEQQRIIAIIDGMKRVNEEFGFCKFGKHHMGDIIHDDICGTHNQTLENLKSAILPSK